MCVHRLVLGSYPPKSVQDQLAVFLEHLAFGHQLRSFRKFGMSISTAQASIFRVSSAIITEFGGYIADPTAQEVEEWAQVNLDKFHLPNCPLAMDGTHIALGAVEPSAHAAFKNHKEGSYAFLAHAVCSPQ